MREISESPDGRWLLAVDPSGVLHLLDLAFPDEPPWPLTLAGVPGPWARDSSGFAIFTPSGPGFFSLLHGTGRKLSGPPKLSDPSDTIGAC
jgi:hypothetical protein